MSQITYIQVLGSDWTFGERYIYAYATYLVACPPDRTCQVGMGPNWFGGPLGEKIRFSGEKEIFVLGAGELHFRVDDGQGGCKVGFIQKSQGLIKASWDF